MQDLQELISHSARRTGNSDNRQKDNNNYSSKKSDKKNYNTDIGNNESFSKYRKWNTNCFGNDKDTFFRKHFRYRYGKYCVKECNRNDSEEERYGSRGNDRKLEL